MLFRSTTARIVPELVHVIDAIADVGAVFPHAIERKILDGAPLTFRFLPCRNKHLDDRALFHLHDFEGPEDAVFVLRGDRHCWGSVDSIAYDKSRGFG